MILQTEAFNFFPVVLCFFFKRMCLRPTSGLWAHAVHSPGAVGKALPLAVCRRFTAATAPTTMPHGFLLRHQDLLQEFLRLRATRKAIPESFHSCHQMLICHGWHIYLEPERTWTHTWYNFFNDCKAQRSQRDSLWASSNQPSAPLPKKNKKSDSM